MNIDVISSIKYLQTKFNNTLERSYTMFKFVSCHRWKDGST
jgi:hypothetical protein